MGEVQASSTTELQTHKHNCREGKDEKDVALSEERFRLLFGAHGHLDLDLALAKV